jgi:hypothetical protein
MPLDSELIRDQMYLLNINVVQLSEISGIAANKLSLFVNGTRGMRNDEVISLRQSLVDIAELIKFAEPFPLSFKKTAVIRDLIVRMKKGELPRRQQ